jgi:membrane-associated phospholipid phosphatase
MKVFLCGLALLWSGASLPALAQQSELDTATAMPAALAQGGTQDVAPQGQNVAQQGQTAAPQSQNIPPQQVNRSALGVKPGAEALQNKDFYQNDGYLHPFRRMARFVAEDQERIWTSPFRTKKSDAKYWLIFGGATATLIAFDARIERNAPSPTWLVDLGTKGSYLGAAYTLIPISAGLYFLGSTAGSQKFRETGLLSFEALANTEMTAEVIKVIADRQRPLDDGGNGHFFESNDRLNASFPSGHAINTFALASVFAHEYHNKTWVKVLAYGYAGTVVLSRLIAKQHFAGDTMAGGAMGWFIGDYVYAKRHNPDVDKQTAIQKFLAHVQIGGRLY